MKRLHWTSFGGALVPSMTVAPTFVVSLPLTLLRSSHLPLFRELEDFLYGVQGVITGEWGVSFGMMVMAWVYGMDDWIGTERT